MATVEDGLTSPALSGVQVANEFMANDDFCDEFQLADMRRLESCTELCKDCTSPKRVCALHDLT